MTVTGTEGVFSYGIQSAKGTLATTFYRHKAMNIDYGAVERMALVPQEVGGIAVPTGAYKSGAFIGGGATMNLRTEGDAGWLFKGLLGTVTSRDALATENGVLASSPCDGATIPDGSLQDPPASRKLVIKATASAIVASGTKNVVLNGPGATPTETINIAATAYVAGEVKYFYGATAFSNVDNIVKPTQTGLSIEVGWVGEATTKDHFFTLSDQASLPWLSVRKLIPGSTANNEHGTVGLDNRVVSLAMTLPNTGLVSSRVDFLGREPSFVVDPSWTYADAFEDTDTIPLTCKTTGYLKLPGFSANKLPVIGAQVSIANQVTTPDQEQIIGSPYPDDVTRTLTAMTFRLTMKWNDPDLYEKILTGNITGTTWKEQIFYSDLDILAESPDLIVPGTGVLYHGLRIKANRCALQIDQPPALAGGQMVVMGVTGQVVEQTWGDYCQLILRNAQSAY